MGEKKKSSKIYFGQETENAVIAYVSSTNLQEREVIFLRQLKDPLEKLIENIIFTYNFNNLEADWIYLQAEVLSHLYQNLDKFDPERGTKSYSYLGTMAKNYLIQRSIKQTTEHSINVSLDNQDKAYYEAEIDEAFADKGFLEGREIREFIELVVQELEKEYLKAENKEQKKTIEAVIYFLANRDKEDVYNKKYLYLLLKERTGLSTRQLTKCLKQVKDVYARVRHRFYG